MQNGVLKNGLNGFQLKIIAICAMVIDHAAWVFLRPYTENFALYVLYEILRGIGRFTMPIMCMLLVDGFFYTRSVKKYLIRLFIFALISHVPYYFFDYGIFSIGSFSIYKFQTSIIFNLFLCLCTLVLLKTEKICAVLKLFGLSLLFLSSWFCDWRFLPIMLTVLFYAFYKKRFIAIGLYLPVVLIWLFIHHWAGYFMLLLEKGNPFIFALQNALPSLIEDFPKILPYKLFFIGLFFLIPFFCLYNGKPGNFKKGSVKAKISKWFFYLFYPLHLLILAFIKYGNPFIFTD